jgi:hypothetical protein
MQQQLASLQQQLADLLAAVPTAAPAHGLPQQQTSRFATSRPRADDLREYEGASGSKLDAWLNELVAAVQLYRLNSGEAVDFATSRLRGAAQQWWTAQDAVTRATAGASVDALGAALRSRFQPVTAARVAREQLFNLRQGSRHINDYVGEFQQLRAQVSDMNEAEALFIFERGLSAALQAELRRQGCVKLTEAVDLAARVGSSAAAAAAPSAGRSSATQMETDSGGTTGSGEDMMRSLLNALHSHNSGMGAKTQTQRGYAGAREQSGSSYRNRGGGARGGRGGGSGSRWTLPVIPGVPAEVVQQRWDAKQCVRCGGDDHRGIACPNSISAMQSKN